MRPAKNRVGPFEGTIELLVEPNTIGYLLTGIFGEDTHSTYSAGVSEQSDFQPLNTLQTFTMDIKIAGESYVTRYFGVRCKKATWTIDENKLKLALDVSAQRVFSNARVTTAAGSGTSLDLDQSSGLTTSDTIIVLDADDLDSSLAELTIAAINSETNLTTSTIGASLAVDDVVVIKAQTIDPDNYDLGSEFIFSGGASVYIGNGTNAMQRLAAMTNCEGFELTVENDLEPRWAATGVDVIDRMPSTILVKGVMVNGKFSQFHANPKFMDILRQMEQTGLRFEFQGDVLSANSAASATGVVESDGAGTVTVTVTATGDAGNDYAIKVVQGTSSGAATATLSDKLITLTLSTTAGNNAVATIATLLDGLSNVTAASSGTGNVTTTDNPDKIQFANGRDASERAKIRFDLPNVRFKPFQPNLGNDDIVQEEIEFDAFRDSNDEREIKVRLLNDITAY